MTSCSFIIMYSMPIGTTQCCIAAAHRRIAADSGRQRHENTPDHQCVPITLLTPSSPVVSDGYTSKVFTAILVSLINFF